MPSLRDQPPSAPRVSAPAVPTPPAAPVPKPAPLPPDSERDDEEARAGGFHESSYELRTGMDVFEGDWPEDTTIPGAFDDE